jgi:starch phosphorylase
MGAWDAVEAEALYDLLERQFVPEFYRRDASGIPIGWVARMRESMAHLTPRFSTNRAVREYTERYYLPAASTYRERAADKGAKGAQLVAWRRTLDREWGALRFGQANVTTDGEQHAFEVEVYLGGLDPEAVRIELYADAVNDAPPVRQEMKRVRDLKGSPDGGLYRGVVSAVRPPADYTPRAIPRRAGIALPLEDARIAWQR